MHLHPLSLIRHSAGLKKLIQAAFQVSPERQAGEQFQKIMSICNGANALRLIHRFIDRRQLHLLKYPKRVDASDINPQQSHIFVYERRLQRLWIRLLHRKGLHRFDTRLANGVRHDVKVGQSLYEIYTARRLFLEEKIATKRGNGCTDDFEINWDDPASDIFQWMPTMRKVILTALEAMKTIALTPRASLAARFTQGPAPAGPQLTDERLLEVNLGDVRILDRMVAVSYAFPNTTLFKSSFI
jgi:hypothetical protein